MDDGARGGGGGGGGGGTILQSIGSEIIGVMSPVSICMLLVVLLVSTLSSTSTTAGATTQIRTAANLVYLESPTDTTLQKLEGALLNAVVFVLLISLVTFLLVILYYYNFTSFLKHYTRFSAFFVLATMGGTLFISLIQHFSIPVDSLTFFVLLFNFSLTGVVSVFSRGFPIFVKQFYMVCLGIIVAAWFTQLPEWTTWILLVALALYDLVAVLAPGGPLKILVELASSREEEIPALVYEARPNVGSSGSSNRLGNMGLLVAGVTQLTTTTNSISNRNNSNDSENGGNESIYENGNGSGSNDRAIELPTLSRIGNEKLNGNSGSSDDNVGDETDGNHRVVQLQEVLGIGRREDREDHVINVEGSGNEIEVIRDDDHMEETSPLMAGNLRGRRGGMADGGNGGGDGDGERENARSSSGVSLLEMVSERGRNGRGRNADDDDDDDDESMAGRGIKLGLGDFIFYSVLVGRAAMYDLMTVYACYLAIISGLGCTLILLAVCRHALPALPISIALGVMFYFLTRLLMEPFVVGASTNLMMF